jgi:hypothetical protein
MRMARVRQLPYSSLLVCLHLIYTNKLLMYPAVAILGAGRNSLSFFLLLVVSLGLSVVRETLPAMMRCRILAGAHFIFGGKYHLVISLQMGALTIQLKSSLCCGHCRDRIGHGIGSRSFALRDTFGVDNDVVPPLDDVRVARYA